MKKRIAWMDKEVIDEQMSAVKKATTSPSCRPSSRTPRRRPKELLDQLQNKNQRLFTYTGLVFTYADAADSLDHQTRQIMAAARQRSIEVEPLAYRQRQRHELDPAAGPEPRGGVALHDDRADRHTDALRLPGAQPGRRRILRPVQAVGQPRNLQPQEAREPHGVRLRQAGLGKSFSVKREIMNTILAYPDDEVIVFDPAGNTRLWVEPAGGTCIRFSSPDTDTFMNPFDLSDVADKANQAQLAFKIDAILALSSATMAEGARGCRGGQVDHQPLRGACLHALR